jgi:hypothetical protein
MMHAPLKTRVFAMALGLLAPAMAPARAADDCRFQLDCKLGDLKATLTFASPSKDCTGDDMTVTWSRPDASGSTSAATATKPVRLALDRRWYAAIEHLGDGTPVCAVGATPYPAYAAGGKRALVFTHWNGRPSYDHAAAFLIDLATGRLIAAESDLGESKNHYLAFLATAHGYRVRVVREWLKQVACDCDASAVDDWREVSVSGDRLRTAWWSP